MDIISLSKEELRHIFLVGTHLHKFQGKEGEKSISDIIKSQGMIQYDPLNPAGRYHDHFLLSRIQNYKQGDFERIAYKKKLIFEYYNPNLCAIAIEHFPTFRPLMEKRILNEYYQTRIANLRSHKPTMLEDVYDYVKKNGITTGKDLSHLGKAHKEYASWKSNQISSSVLEYLWVMGKLAVVERTALFQKKYDLIENYIPTNYLSFIDESFSESFNKKLMVMHKSFPIISVGKLSKKNDTNSFMKKKNFIDLNEYNNEFLFANVEETAKIVLIPKNYNELLSIESYDDNMRMIGVLDPLIWDRELLKHLFNFDYTWEVYKKGKDRIWGYYVFPLLFHGKFVGRFECKAMQENDHKILKIFNLRLERGIKITNTIKKAFKDLLDSIASMLSVDKISKDSSIKKLI